MILKKYKYYYSLTLKELIRKGANTAFRWSSKAGILIRRVKAYTYFGKFGVNVGTNVKFSSLTLDVSVGKGFEIYNNCIFEFSNKSSLKIGNNCLFSYGVLLQCLDFVSIGDDVQIGEYTSLRDTTHSYNFRDIPIKYQKDVSKGIEIGNDVWIGRGCIILPGTKIGNGVIIGANSVVKGRLDSFGIYAGSPVKLIKKREHFT